MGPTTIIQKLVAANETAWLTLGNVAELMSEWDKAIQWYESALAHNPYSVRALTQIASLCRGREKFDQAIEYFKRVLAIQESDGETWANLGHCYLMMDHLQEAYHAYQQALYHLPNPKDPKLWYGIGILYDRYGSIEHAEEAFSAIIKMDPHFDKTNEIYFRLGIIYKAQQKFELSLQCFDHILPHPPNPLTKLDIWLQQGQVYEQQKEYDRAKKAYEQILTHDPHHPKVLQQLGWLFHQQDTTFNNQTTAIQYLTHSLKTNSQDAQSWYLLGRCYMTEKNYSKAFEAYQQAVHRDARNPIFWCSIGVLYFQINQYHDALDAYSQAIRLNPSISEVWYDLGTLYESCNNQMQDALDAYQRASELNPKNLHIRQRLDLLKRNQHDTGVKDGSLVMTAPVPQDVEDPYQYNDKSVPFDRMTSIQQQQKVKQPAVSSPASSISRPTPNATAVLTNNDPSTDNASLATNHSSTNKIPSATGTPTFTHRVPPLTPTLGDRRTHSNRMNPHQTAPPSLNTLPPLPLPSHRQKRHSQSPPTPSIHDRKKQKLAPIQI